MTRHNLYVGLADGEDFDEAVLVKPGGYHPITHIGVTPAEMRLFNTDSAIADRVRAWHRGQCPDEYADMDDQMMWLLVGKRG